LLVPLLVALVAADATVAAVLFATAGCLAFVANESLLVVLGHRGLRARQSDGARARRLLCFLVPMALATGIAGLVVAPAPARVMACIVAAPLMVLLLLAWNRCQRSVGGELVAAIVLTGAAAPVMAVSAVPLRRAALLWAAWAYGYACTIIAIHRVIDRHKRSPARIDHLVSVGLVVAVVAVVAVATVHRLALVALPLAIASAAVAIVAPAATHLRSIGFGLVTASVLSAGLALALA
jgi:hypothetical protein